MNGRCFSTHSSEIALLRMILTEIVPTCQHALRRQNNMLPTLFTLLSPLQSPSPIRMGWSSSFWNRERERSVVVYACTQCEGVESAGMSIALWVSRSLERLVFFLHFNASPFHLSTIRSLPGEVLEVLPGRVRWLHVAVPLLVLKQVNHKIIIKWNGLMPSEFLPCPHDRSLPQRLQLQR